MDQATLGTATVRRRADRTIDELLGVCRGVLADGEVNSQEWRFLSDWIARNKVFIGQGPADFLAQRVAEAFVDGYVDEEEQKHLLEALAQFVGGEVFDAKAESASLATALLPFDDPVPTIEHAGKAFVVTGTFRFGGRRAVEAAILELGGVVLKNLGAGVDYLIVGEIGSRDWIHSAYGRKIERALALRASGHSIALVAEQSWSSKLP